MCSAVPKKAMQETEREELSRMTLIFSFFYRTEEKEQHGTAPVNPTRVRNNHR